MTSVSTTTVTDPSSVNTESAGVEDAESSQGGKPTQLESGHDLTAEEEALLAGWTGGQALVVVQLVGVELGSELSARSCRGQGVPRRAAGRC